MFLALIYTANSSGLTPREYGSLECFSHNPRSLQGVTDQGKLKEADTVLQPYWAEPYTMTGSDGTCDPNITAGQTD